MANEQVLGQEAVKKMLSSFAEEIRRDYDAFTQNGYVGGPKTASHSSDITVSRSDTKIQTMQFK